jgi:retron-type reverse transcriptase
MTEGRRLHRTLLPDPVGSAHQQPPALQGRANQAHTNKQHRCRDRYGCLDAARLLACWSDLHTQAARGVDGLTAQADEAHLQATITALGQRLHTHRYRATLVRRGDIPQENGSARALGIPALEDNLVP